MTICGRGDDGDDYGGGERGKVVRGNETFKVTLSNAVNATLGTARGRGR